MTSLDLKEAQASRQLGSSAKVSPEHANYVAVPLLDQNVENIMYSWKDLVVETSRERSRLVCCRKKHSLPPRQILKGVNGEVKHGDFLAIMGASGAGKTTLLNVLTCRRTENLQVRGKLYLNGSPVNPDALTRISAYVQQEDIFVGTLTVREHLQFQAHLRMDRDIPHEQRMIRVEEVINELGLTKCADGVIGIPGRLKGISGGEKKRLAFASEVLTNPLLMFCDEPTSGLDSYMAENIISVLQAMAEKGKTIICTIHQPSSEVFALFDKLLLMAEGRVAYMGSSKEAHSFFDSCGLPCPVNFNPADFFVHSLATRPGKEEESHQRITRICDTFESRNAGKAMESFIEESAISFTKRKSPYKATWWQQFCAVLWRSMLAILREPQALRVQLFQTIMVSGIITAIFQGQELNEEGIQNINGAMFMIVVNQSFSNVIAVINVFAEEIPIFLREHHNGMYRTDVYFLAKTMADLPRFLILPVIFMSIPYYAIGLNPDIGRFLIACGVSVLIANCSSSYGYMISCLSPSLTIALAISGPMIIPLLLFGGFFLNKSSVPVYFVWLRNLSWFMYGNEILNINQWKGVENITCHAQHSFINMTGTACTLDGDDVLERFSFSEEILTESLEDFRSSSRRSAESIRSELSIEEYTTFLPSIYAKRRANNAKLKFSPTNHGWTPIESGVTLTWKNVSVYVKKESTGWGSAKVPNPPFKRVLNNVFGAVQPGSLVAMMGASGAGKSTLMSTLACRAPNGVMIDGDIRVNGRAVGPFMRDLSGYVHQDDLFIGSMTCREHLEFMAELRLGGSVSRHERKGRIDLLVSELSLKDCEHTQIGGMGFDKGISGGEKKRLSFASEILTDPPILFCDEPTTGLDSFSAETLVKIMQKMAAQGKTIVCTIHQPSSEIYELFGQLILLTEGRVAYMGTTKGVLSFFESFGYTCPDTYNPADFFVQTLAVLPGHEQHSSSTIKAICDRFAVSTQAREIELLIQYELNVGYSIADSQIEDSLLESTVILNRASWPKQLHLLTKRSFVDSVRNPAIHWLRIGQKILLAFLVGLCFTGIKLDQRGIQNIQGAIFMFTTENTFPCLYGVLQVFPKELPLFIREARNGLYRVDAYYLGKVISLLPGFILEPVVFTTIAYWLMGLRNNLSAYLYSMTVVIMTANTASACGTFFSAAFESLSMASAFLIPFDYILMITGGIFINLKTLPFYVRWASYLSWFLYTNEALNIIQWEGLENIACEATTPTGRADCLSTGEQVLTRSNFKVSDYPIDISAMLILYWGFHILGYLSLVRRVRAN